MRNVVTPAAWAVIVIAAFSAACGNSTVAQDADQAADAEKAKEAPKAVTPAPVKLPEGVSWDQEEGLFVWPQGELHFPTSLKYSALPSDTFEGEFVSPSGVIAIHHDIGENAGAWAQKDGAVDFEEKRVNGARVWIGLRGRSHGDMQEQMSVVTFPDNGCANFFIEQNGPAAVGLIHEIADTFVPKNTKKATSTCLQRAKTPAIAPSKQPPPKLPEAK